MRQTWIAAALLLATLFAAARADEGAYGSLVVMASTAAQDRGPDADDAAGRDAPMSDALKDAVAQTPAPRAKTAPAPRAGEDRVVTPAPAAAPRLWTRLYSTLVPSWRRRAALKGEFEAGVSSAAAPSAASLTAADAAAVKAGERRGLAELLSASAAPSDPQ